MAFQPTTTLALITENDIEVIVSQGLTAKDLTATPVQIGRVIQGVVTNLAKKLEVNLNNFITARELELSTHYHALFKHLNQQHQQTMSIIHSLKSQLDALPANVGNTDLRQPKMGEPTEFRGSDDKTKLMEWLNLIALYCEHEKIVTDHQRIVLASAKLRGPAHQYMAAYYEAIRAKRDLGTWDSFVKELSAIYGQRDDKEGAKKEITALFQNKDLAGKDFIKYAERFRTLGRLTGYEDGLLIDKFREVIPRDMRLVLAGKEEMQLPTK